MVDESNTKLMRDYVKETSHVESEKWTIMDSTRKNSYDIELKEHSIHGIYM